MKRGPKVGNNYYVTNRHKISCEFDDLAKRRTQPFLDSIGLDTRPVSHLLKEAWLQGVKDAAAAFNEQTQKPRTQELKMDSQITLSPYELSLLRLALMTYIVKIEAEPVGRSQFKEDMFVLRDRLHEKALEPTTSNPG